MVKKIKTRVNKEPHQRAGLMVSGDVLLSHTVSSAVPSALLGLTSLFEMVRGVSPAISSPGKIFINSGGQTMLLQIYGYQK